MAKRGTPDSATSAESDAAAQAQHEQTIQMHLVQQHELCSWGSLPEKSVLSIHVFAAMSLLLKSAQIFSDGVKAVVRSRPDPRPSSLASR